MVPGNVNYRGMKENCYIKKYTFDQHFQAYQIDNFLVDFFNQAKPRIKSAKDDWKTLERIEKVDVTNID